MVVFFEFALGLGLLFWGMRLLKLGLENAAGAGFKALLRRLTVNPVSGLLTGTVLTALIQSSTAVTVFSMSFVNAGLMSFEQALGIILGSNIGSTITAQLMVFNLSTYALPALALGGILFTVAKHNLKWLGLALMGFALVFHGISIMGESLKPLGASPQLTGFLHTLGDNHSLGIIAGMTLAGLIHSSGVTTGMVIVLASQNMITASTGIAIVLGANVGTCFTALLAAIGADRGAKRVAIAHLLLNTIGVLVCYPLLHPFAAVMSRLSPDLGRQVAHAHTFFNIISSLLILPVLKPFVRLVYFLVPKE
ncbi:MAG: Na/Pi cotransporter family protein [Peptococcaceae bacterium]|nr:Na/Pi cotransporter family protein [Peptococcaceae bacterium]